MCDITHKITDKSTIRKGIVGYKIAIERNGKFYSPATLIEYKSGLVEQPKSTVVPEESLSLDFNCDFLNPTSKYAGYRQLYKDLGLTMVFEKTSDAETQLSHRRRWNSNKIPLCIVKMHVRRNLHEAFYGALFGYVGSYIVSVKKLDDEITTKMTEEELFYHTQQEE